MSKGPLILCVLIELWRFYLTPAASETVVTGFLGQSVTLPCTHSSWSHGSNSMCWGKGECPNSKCSDQLLHTDGTKMLWRKSFKYALQGVIGRGDVSLTIFNTNMGDEGVYCCRIEVPGWFNDVKRNIRLKLVKAPTTTRRPPTRRPTTRRPTTRRPTTRRPTTTTAMTTTTAVLPTTFVTTPDLTTRTQLETRTTTALTAATTCPLTTSVSLPEETTILLTTELSTEGPTFSTEPETLHFSSNSQTSTEMSPEDTALLTSKESTPWVFQSTSKVSMWEMSDSGTFAHKTMPNNLLLIIAPSLIFLLCALTVAFLLRGKVMKTNCFQKHTRLDNAGESKNVLDDMQQGREDEDGLFTL